LANPSNKNLVWLLILEAALIVSVVLSVVIVYYYFYKVKVNTGPLTPTPTATTTITITVHSKPTRAATLPASPTPLVDTAKNCTHSVTYWANHTETWPYQVIIDNFTYTIGEAAAIYSAQHKDVAANLFVQLHAAYLNFLSGADPSAANKTISDTAIWLNTHPVGSPINDFDQQTGITLGMTLASYNNGRLGPGRCANDTALVPADEIPLPTATVTSTVETVTITVTATRRPTRRPPTDTQPPSQPPQPNPPTQTPVQMPTNTPVTPPTPAPTQIPTLAPTMFTP
jgi:hypothetical protein